MTRSHFTEGKEGNEGGAPRTTWAGTTDYGRQTTDYGTTVTKVLKKAGGFAPLVSFVSFLSFCSKPGRPASCES